MKHLAYPRSVLLLAGALLLGGCAAINDATMRALASSASAQAVIGERVVTGEMLLYTDRSGKLQLRSDVAPALSCMGALRYTATTSGAVNLSCSDGTQARLPFTALSETSGYGGMPGGPVSFTYGLAPEPARAWLTPPPGKRLVVEGNSLRIE
jgi:hypothetical protein